MTQNLEIDLFTYNVEMDKAVTSLFYFILEANEGIAFYSTLDQIKDPTKRIVQVNCTLGTHKQLQGILERFNQNYPLEVELIDSP